MQIANVPESLYGAGLNTVLLDLPSGAQTLRVTYTTPQPNWPDVSDGQIALRLMVDRGGGFVQEWSDTFQHVVVRRAGSVWSPLAFEARLQRPFAVGDRVRVEAESEMAFRTAVTVDAA